MKKVAVFVMITLLCFTLYGCKSKAVKETEQAIDAIGIVTLESEAAIRQAQKMYEFLTDGEKVKVSNRMVLADALETYAAAVAAYQEEQLQKQREEIVSIYTALKEAADLLDKQGTDLYEAWRVAIYDSEEFEGSNLNGAMKHLKSELFLSYEELLDGAACVLTETILGGNWADKPETDKQKSRDSAATGTLFWFCSGKIPAACVLTVGAAYRLNGSVETIENALHMYQEKKPLLYVPGTDDAIWEHMEQLYVSIAAYLDYCQNPTGSFDQSSETINGYRTEIRNAISRLDGVIA